ncbi:hypothetical protein BS78_07G102400 [Paspalum vaginatum]|nr:hypothetical protein BS78_07G102400 [Paspalum vaginatum]
MVDCFDAETCELIMQGRGRIAVTAESVANILRLPIGGDPVRYEYDVDAMNFMLEKLYPTENGEAPTIKSILEMLQLKEEADDDFFRSWLMIAVSTFLCPTTALSISLGCYPALVDLTRVKELVWCKFVVDQLKVASENIDKKNSIRGCLLFLVVLYVDSLDVGDIQVPDIQPRIAAWNWKLLNKVIKLDTNRDGSFGKLKSVVQDSIFRMDDIRRFVSSKVHNGMSDQNKNKLSNTMGDVCVGFTELMGKFLE